MSELSKKMASMNEAENNGYLVDEEILDPIDNAIKPEPFADEGHGTKSFTKPDGGKFFVGPMGISFLPAGQSNDKLMAVCGALEVIARYRDSKGNGWGRVVRWFDSDGTQHKLNISEADLTIKPTEVLAELENGGLSVYVVVSRGGRNRVVDFIKSYPVEALPLQRSTQSFGWFGDNEAFVLPDRVIGGDANEVVIFDGDESHAPKFAQKGTLKEWQDNVASVAQYSSRIGFFTCIGFASPLARLVSELTGGFHLVGDSSLGKSSALRVLCSVFASSASRGDSGEMATWRATDNAMENVCQSHSDLPLICDELGQADAKKLQSMIYMIGNEAGKKRMSGKTFANRPTASWRLMLASSGEATVEDLCKRVGVSTFAGVKVRLADIVVTNDNGLGIFDCLPSNNPKEIAEKLREDTERKYYGVAGPAYLERLVKAMHAKGREAFCDWLTKEVDRISSQLMAGEKDHQVGRVARRFALVSVAGELAIDYQVLPWAKGTASRFATVCFDVWRKGYKTQAEQNDDLLEMVKNFHERRKAHFDFLDKTKKTTFSYGGYEDSEPVESRQSQRFGTIVVESNGITVFYFRDTFRDFVLEPNGFQWQRSLKALKDAGILKVNDRDYYYKVVKDKGIGKFLPSKRYICIEIGETES